MSEVASGQRDRLAVMFEQTAREDRPALIGFIPGSWPEPGATLPLVQAAVAGGADAIEIGVPFSDPLADGATNQAAYYESLQAGASTAGILDEVRAVRAAGVTVPILLMGYYNPLLAYGIDRFVTDARAAGIDGLIIVDLPPEEATELEGPARRAGLHMVYLVAPTSTDERLRVVAAHCTGFMYCVSVAGVTGARTEVAADLPEFIARVRAHTDLPLAIGFGISSGEQVRNVGQHAEAAIVGSALVQTISRAAVAERTAEVRAFIGSLRGQGETESQSGGASRHDGGASA